MQVAQVTYSGIRAHALHLLVIPKREGVVVAIGEYNGVAFFLQAHQVVLTKVAAGVTVAAVMVIPGLAGHLYRHEDAGQAGHRGCQHSVDVQFLEPVYDGCHAQSAPYSEGIERSGVSIVTFARLRWCLVEVDHNGQTCHEEQEGHHPELLYAAFSAPCLPEEAYDAQQQRQAIEHVVAFVGLQLVGQLALVAVHSIVYEGYTRYPVAMFHLTIALNVVLAAREVPHKVTPIHEVALVREEEAQVLKLRRHLDGLAGVVGISHLMALYAAHPLLILLRMCLVVHSGEEHVLRIHIVALVANQVVLVGLIG